MIKTRRTKRTFSPEFKLEAIEQVVKYQRDVREVPLALELTPDHLRKWIRLYKQELQGIQPAGNAITPAFLRSSSLKLSNRWLNTSVMSEKSRWLSSSPLTICVNGYGCISRNFRVFSPLVMLLPLNNAKFSSLKRR